VFEKLNWLWSIFSVMLGAGGLLKEKVLGTAPFSLSLPASRRYCLGVRCSVNIFEAACLALIPHILVPLTAPLVQQSYLFSRTLAYVGILMTSGIAIVILGILISVALEGMTWPAIIGATTVFLLLALGEALNRLSLHAPAAVLSGEAYFRHGSLPWFGMSVSLLVASLMLAFALWIVKWQDF
jgi:ABC-2 type transport system permease protein